MGELEVQIRNRQEKRERLREEGVDPYPGRVSYDLEPAAVQALHGDKSAEALEEEALELTVPGRLRARRSHGKTVFLDLHDGAAKLQAMVRAGALDDLSRRVLESLDLGDYLAVRGPLIRTRTGELTVAASSLELLAKAVRPMPEKWHGLSDVEARYRQRYLDLVANPEVRRVFETRAALIRYLRRFLDERGFLEVETPMMQPLPGGAVARPFVTHHNALDMELYLRIAPELYLKRLLVGGLHRVYEINRNFRNEGISTQHNPEFTMLELYQAYSDFEQLMELTEEMLHGLVSELREDGSLSWKGETVALARPWSRFTLRRALEEVAGVAPDRLESLEGLEREYRERELELPREGAGWGRLLMDLFEALVEPRLVQPTFITHFPVEVSPLAKQAPEDSRFAERFELFAGGMELANAFTELNDPVMQARRFREQLAARDLGDEEAHRFDEDYVLALEHGMPPAGGLGVGIDRLTMLLTDSHSIRDVILFPLLRPPGEDDSGR